MSLTLLSKKIPWLSSACLSARQRSTTSLLHLSRNTFKSPCHIISTLKLTCHPIRNLQPCTPGTWCNLHEKIPVTRPCAPDGKVQVCCIMQWESMNTKAMGWSCAVCQTPGTDIQQIIYLKVSSKDWPNIFLHLQNELCNWKGPNPYPQPMKDSDTRIKEWQERVSHLTDE